MPGVIHIGDARIARKIIKGPLHTKNRAGLRTVGLHLFDFVQKTVKGIAVFHRKTGLVKRGLGGVQNREIVLQRNDQPVPVPYPCVHDRLVVIRPVKPVRFKIGRKIGKHAAAGQFFNVHVAAGEEKQIRPLARHNLSEHLLVCFLPAFGQRIGKNFLRRNGPVWILQVVLGDRDVHVLRFDTVICVNDAEALVRLLHRRGDLDRRRFGVRADRPRRTGGEGEQAGKGQAERPAVGV